MRVYSAPLLSAVALLLLLILSEPVEGIANYKECLECFYENRTTTYYCQSNRRCLPLRSTQCSQANIIFRDYQCVEGFQDCTNVTFTMNSVGQSVQYGYQLTPGNGCYIQIDRLQMGSIGSMAVAFDDPSSILVFDKDNRNYQSGDVLTMPVTEYGWGPRKIFVVNRGT